MHKSRRFTRNFNQKNPTMRTLEFPNSRTFELVYEGLAVSKASGAEARALGRIFTKLEAAGKQKPNELLYTGDAGCIVRLEENEFQLAKKLLDLVEFNGIGSRFAGAMLEWLDDIKIDSPTVQG